MISENATSGDSAAHLLHPMKLANTLGILESHLCGFYPDGFESYLQMLIEIGSEGSPCTSVWTAGSIAYRCRTCQMNDSSAICVTCFQTGGHEKHDYSLYRSEAGGCCDCGDVVSWKAEGCCPRHRRSASKAAGGARMSQEMHATTHQVLKIGFEMLLASCDILLGDLQKDTNMDENKGANAISMEPVKRILKWLQKLCGAAALRDASCVVLRELDHIRTSAPMDEAYPCINPELCAIRDGVRQLRADPGWFVSKELMIPKTTLLDSLAGSHYFLRLPLLVLNEVTTLLLLLLFNNDMKLDYSLCMLRHYRPLVLPQADARGKRLPMEHIQGVAQCLDRLTVQLFNSQESTLLLAKEHGLLDTLMNLLSEMFGTVSLESKNEECAPGLVSVEHDIVKHKLYYRVLGDVRMALTHPQVTIYFLEKRMDLVEKFLHVLGCMQGMNGCVRATGDHVLWESSGWMHAVQLEQQMVSLVQHAASAFARPTRSTAEVLLRAAQRFVHFASLWAQADVKRAPDWSLSSGRVSMHLPLHRATAVLVTALAQCDRELGIEGGKKSTLERLIRLHREDIASLAEHPLRMLSWMAQVRAGMWKRNGNEVRLQEHVYHSSFWHEHSLNLDVLVLQLSLSVAPSGEQTALRIAEIFQMDAKSIEEIGRRMHAGDPDAIRSNRYLTKCHRDLMRLLVVLARERAHVGAREEAARLRRALVQWLCTGPQTHTKLVGNLSASLANHPDMQETLHAVAAYHQPNLQEQGCYSLRAECWREFDPYFPHFSVVQVEQALREAHASGAWDPAAQLRPFVPPLASLQGSMPVIQCHSNLGIIMNYMSRALKSELPEEDHSALHAVQMIALLDVQPNTNLAKMFLSNQTTLSKSMIDLLRQLTLPRASDSTSGGLEDVHDTATAMWMTLRKCATRLVSELEERGVCPSPRPGAPANGNAPGNPSTATGAATPAITEPSSEGDEAAAAAQERKRKMKERQAAVMAQFAARQQAFAKGSASLSDGSDDANAPRDETEEGNSLQAESHADHDVAHEHPPSQSAESAAACSLCRGGRESRPAHATSRSCSSPGADPPSQPLGMVAMVQRSNLPLRASRPMAADEWRAAATGGEGAAAAAATLPLMDVLPGVHIKCCGHFMHVDCFQRYTESLQESKNSNTEFEGMRILCLEAGEFLCPICRRLANALVPATTHRSDDCEGRPAAPASQAQDAQQATGSAGSSSLDSVYERAQAATCAEPLDAGPDVHPVEIRPERDACTEAFLIRCWSVMTEMNVWRGGLAAHSAMVRVMVEAGRAQPLASPPAPAAPRKVMAAECAMWLVLAHNVAHYEAVSRPLPHAATAARDQGASPGEDVLKLLAPQWTGMLQIAGMCMLGPDVPSWSKEASAPHKVQHLLEWLFNIPAAATSHAAPSGVHPSPESEAGPSAASPGGGGAPAGSQNVPGVQKKGAPSFRSRMLEVVQQIDLVKYNGWTNLNLTSKPNPGEIEFEVVEDTSGAIPAQHVAMPAKLPWRAVRERAARVAALRQWSTRHHPGRLAQQPQTSSSAGASWNAGAAGLGGVGGAGQALGAPGISAGTAEPESGGSGQASAAAEHAAAREPAEASLTAATSSARSSSGWEEDEIAMLLAADPFALLVELLAAAAEEAAAAGRTLGSARSREAQQDQFTALLQVMYAIAATQALVEGCVSACLDASTNQAPEPDPEEATQPGGEDDAHVSAQDQEEEAAALRWAYDLGLEALAQSPPSTAVGRAVQDHLGWRCLPLLRRAALLQALLQGQSRAPTLPALPPTNPQTSASAIELLARQLGLESSLSAVCSLLRQGGSGGGKSPGLVSADVLGQWCHHTRAGAVRAYRRCLSPPPSLPALAQRSKAAAGAHKVSGGAVATARAPTLLAPSLLPLPALFQDLYVCLADRKCETCNKAPKEPALCLVCGTLVCFAGKCCATGGFGECTRHAESCGAGMGIFLLVQATRILLLRRSRMSMSMSPYLDSHGEEDVNLKRGRPLYLSILRYGEIQRLWAASAFDYDSRCLKNSRIEGPWL